MFIVVLTAGKALTVMYIDTPIGEMMNISVIMPPCIIGIFLFSSQDEFSLHILYRTIHNEPSPSARLYSVPVPSFLLCFLKTLVTVSTNDSRRVGVVVVDLVDHVLVLQSARRQHLMNGVSRLQGLPSGGLFFRSSSALSSSDLRPVQNHQ